MKPIQVVALCLLSTGTAIYTTLAYVGYKQHKARMRAYGVPDKVIHHVIEVRSV